MLRFEPLDRHHDRGQFDCGVAALNSYLANTARQHADKGISRTFVAVDESALETIIGYFTLTVAEIDRDLLPEQPRKRLPEGGLPVIKLARLAIAQAYQGQGFGGVLLVEALKRSAAAQKLTGSIALVVEAKNEGAAAFYEHFGFVPSADNGLVLFMGFKPILALMESCHAVPGQ